MHGILTDAWKMEYSYEIINQKEAEKYAESKHIKTLMEHLIEDSTRHRKLVADLFRMIGENEPSSYQQKPLNFNFDRSTDRELVQQIIWVEKKMVALYDKALSLISEKDSYDFIAPDDLIKFRESLTMLIKWERLHQRMGEETLAKID